MFDVVRFPADVEKRMTDNVAACLR